MITPHINAKENDFSDLVIMSGDPIRIRYIADKFLKYANVITNVRSMLGVTGYYKDYKISLMSHGMGVPSASIYVEELIKYYSVKKIIRLGTCGTVQEKIKLNDIIIAMGCCTDSVFNRNKFNNYDFSAISDFELLFNTIHVAKYFGFTVHVGNFFTTDTFYLRSDKIYKLLKKYNILGIDMETAGIYNIASEFHIQAMSMCCVSDHITWNKKLSIADRSYSFDKMIKLALETIIL